MDKKEWACLLYIREHLTQEEIANKVGVTRQTIAKWIKDHKWEEQKIGLTLTREQTVSNLHRQVYEINKLIAERPDGERYSTPKEADTLLKIAGTINRLESESGISEIVGVGMLFLSFLRKADLSKAREYTLLWDAFISERL